MTPGDVVHIGRHPECGHIRFAAVVRKGDKVGQRAAATEIADCIRRGLSVETTTDIDVVRKGFGSCVACDEDEQRKAKAAPAQGSLKL